VRGCIPADSLKAAAAFVGRVGNSEMESKKASSRIVFQIAEAGSGRSEVMLAAKSGSISLFGDGRSWWEFLTGSTSGDAEKIRSRGLGQAFVLSG
jgi:hypothetical protein